MRALKQRFDHVSELRGFAQEVADLGGLKAVALAARMRKRAAAVMTAEDPVAKGRIDPHSLFKTPAGAALGRVEVRRAPARVPGTIKLKAAA